MAVVLDASVLIGFLYQDDEHHRRCREAMQAPDIVEAEWIVPATVCAEVLVGAYRGPSELAELIEEFFAEGVDRVQPATLEIAQSAARIRAEHSRLSLSDAFVVATGHVLDADVVLTSDRSWSRVSGAVRVV